MIRPRQAFADVQTRQRMLDAFLLRLTRSADPDAYVLRGGMLVRHWFPERSVLDVDLVCGLPWNPADVRQRLTRILAHELDDGVVFDERFRIDPIWVDTEHPGMRLFATGLVDGWFGELSVDLTFQLPVWPAARREPMRLGAETADVWVCPPSMLVGRKLRVTVDLARTAWRPKDVADLWQLLHTAPDGIGEAIERTCPDVGAVRELLHGGWWERGARRWARFHRPGLPRELDVVVGDLAHLLTPVMP